MRGLLLALADAALSIFIRDSAARLPLNAPLKTLPPDGKA
jgi:hypothetical protein